MPLDIISVAPMLDCTDRHFRYLIRLISRNAFLYTEMLTIKDVLEDKTGRVLELKTIENPVAIQLGGSHPEKLAVCGRLAVEAGYDEINLNVGCPSDRVQSGGIGACLMLQPSVVAKCVESIAAVSSVPVTVKCRLGVDHQDSYQNLFDFIKILADSGCAKIIIHARKAWLKGLSPKQNREIPPLEYDKVYRIKNDFPDLQVILNGGIKSIDDIDHHLGKVDGVMIGRTIYSNPYFLSPIDSQYFGQNNNPSEFEVIKQYMGYMENELCKGTRLGSMTRHLIGLFHNKPRASYWRKHLSTQGSRKGAGVEVIEEALDAMRNSLGKVY